MNCISRHLFGVWRRWLVPLCGWPTNVFVYTSKSCSRTSTKWIKWQMPCGVYRGIDTQASTSHIVDMAIVTACSRRHGLRRRYEQLNICEIQEPVCLHYGIGMSAARLITDDKTLSNQYVLAALVFPASIRLQAKRIIEHSRSTHTRPCTQTYLLLFVSTLAPVSFRKTPLNSNQSPAKLYRK